MCGVGEEVKHEIDSGINDIFHCNCAIVLNHVINISSVLCLRVVFLTEVEKYRKEMNFELMCTNRFWLRGMVPELKSALAF